MLHVMYMLCIQLYAIAYMPCIKLYVGLVPCPVDLSHVYNHDICTIYITFIQMYITYRQYEFTYIQSHIHYVDNYVYVMHSCAIVYTLIPDAINHPGLRGEYMYGPGFGFEG